MANKLCTVLDNLETKLKTLIPATLKSFKRKPILLGQNHNTPVLGMVANRLSRDKPIWTCHVSLPLLARAGGEDSDAAIIILIGEVTEAIEALADSGDAGGHINQPRWDFWYTPIGENLRKVGAIGALTITVTDPLKTA